MEFFPFYSQMLVVLCLSLDGIDSYMGVGRVFLTILCWWWSPHANRRDILIRLYSHYPSVSILFFCTGEPCRLSQNEVEESKWRIHRCRYRNMLYKVSYAPAVT